MNIEQAKQEIKNTLRAYLRRDEKGSYAFPSVRQRPILLMGPPGIGKTAIMEQIAQETGVALVSYTMTHHTRQSAIGLPQIGEQSFGDQVYSVTRYTMSEIIASVYERMAQTGLREGILFLDEINCVSDTLAPTMLQFLQNKTFGSHRLPEGWLIVAAGNPPEYNKSVREYDIVTLDRLRRIDVTPDLEAFRAYSAAGGLHGAISSYLALHPDSFYYVSRREDSVQYVTARGWEDLSALLTGYEALQIPVSEEIIGEYLCRPETAREFFAYYCLYRKFGMDYAIPEILSGNITTQGYFQRCAMARSGDFTERFTVVNLAVNLLSVYCRRYAQLDELVVQLHEALNRYIAGDQELSACIAARRKALETRKQFGLMSAHQQKQEEELLEVLDAMALAARESHIYTREDTIASCKVSFEVWKIRRENRIRETRTAISNAFRFLTDSFGDGQELTLLLSSMTDSPVIMSFIARHGCPEYTRSCERLQNTMVEAELLRRCREYLGE